MGLQSSYLQSIAEELVPLYSQLETDIMTDVARRIVKTGKFTTTAEWQILKAKEAGILNRAAVKKASVLSGQTESELKKTFCKVCTKAIAADDAIYKAAGLDLAPVSANLAFRQIMLAGVTKTKGLYTNFTLTTANSAGLIYEALMDQAYMQVISGAFSFDEALRKAVSSLASQGITKLTYNSGSVAVAESAARRSLLTGLNQTTAQLQLLRCQEAGCNLVEVTSHLGARPSHALWQGMVYSLSGKGGKYRDFRSATGYGDGDGLCGWNCYHSFYPFYEGLSVRAFSNNVTYKGKTNAQAYVESQKQRAYERAIRESKRRVAVLDAAINAASSSSLQESLYNEFSQASITLSSRRRRLEAYLEATDRQESVGRLYIPGYSQSTSGKAVWAARKAE